MNEAGLWQTEEGRGGGESPLKATWDEKAELVFSRLTPGGRVVQAEGTTDVGVKAGTGPGDGRSERFGWSWRMNWWEEVTMESRAEAGAPSRPKRLLSGTNKQERLTEAPLEDFHCISNSL